MSWRIKVVNACLLGFLLTACAVSLKSVDLAQYSQTGLDKEMASVKPPEYVVRRQTPKVAILEFADHSEHDSWKLGSLGADLFHAMAASLGRFRVVERAQAKKIAQELGYQQEHGASWETIEQRYFALGKDVDFVIVGSVNRATTNVNQRPGYYDPYGNAIPPMCEATVEVSVSARVIDMASALTSRTFEMNGKEVQVQQFGCQATPDMARKALEKAVKVVGPVEMTQAVPIYGYIKRMMTESKNPKHRVAFINLGENDGIKPGDQIEVLATEEDVDPIAGQRSLRYKDIGNGIVAQNGLTAKESIVIIEDAKSAQAVKVGHVVRPTAERAKAEAAKQQMQDTMKQLWQTFTR